MRPDPATYAQKVRHVEVDDLRFLRTRHRGKQLIDEHHHGRTTTTLVLDGSFSETLDGRTHRLASLDLVCKPAGLAHSNEFPGEARCFVLELGEDTDLTSPAAGGASPDGPWVGGGAASAIALQLCLLVFEQGVRDSLTIQEAVALLRNELLGRRGREKNVRRPPWLDRVRTCLRDRPELPPPLSELADLAETHPAHLCRVWRSQFGMTIGEFSRRLRIDRAVQALRLDHTPLSELALQLGYFDQAHFTRDFTRFVRIPPGRFRAMVQPGQSEPGTQEP